MASSSTLHLFPSAVPRKSSMRKPHTTDALAAAGELRGVAVHITAGSPKILPAPDTFKHSLFCEPSVRVDATEDSTRRRPGILKRRSSIVSSASATTLSNPLPVDRDQLTPLPENKRFSSSSSIARRPSKYLSRPEPPRNISTEAQIDEASIHDPDQLSPLPDKLCFESSVAPPPEYPKPLSLRSASPAPARSSSRATSKLTTTASATPTRSIFPQYNHDRPRDRQAYFPTVTSPASVMSGDKSSQFASPVDRLSVTRFDSAWAVVDGYEHIPVAGAADTLAIWRASLGQFPVAGRKVRLALHQPRGRCASLVVGISAEEPLFSMSDMPRALSPHSSTDGKQVMVEKHCPQSEAAIPVAQLCLPDQATNEGEGKKGQFTMIFPQAAAIHAIEAISNSPAAAEIATFDPTASSPAASRLAQDAVAEAHRVHGCELVRNTRKHDTSGGVTATYILEHAILGAFAITVNKSTNQNSRDARAKITLHHPSATPAAVAADTLALAFLDFSRDACVLDVPALLALSSPYIIDMTITALLAVAAIENDALLAETVTFEPPPKTPASTRRPSSRGVVSESGKSKRWHKRSSKVMKRAQDEIFGEQVELPFVTRGAIAVVGLSLKAALFFLEAGVKATTSVVVGGGKLASRA